MIEKSEVQRQKPQLDAAGVLLFALLVGVLITAAIKSLLEPIPEAGQFLLHGYADHRTYMYIYIVWTVFVPMLILVSSQIWNRRSNQNGIGHQVRDLAKQEVHKDTIRRSIRWCTATIWVLVCWALIGPPWNIGANSLTLNNHETIHLKGIQAILSGRMPYLDSASSQYGPLIQRGAVWYMNFIGDNSLESHREFWAILNIIGTIGIVVATCLILHPIVASVVNGLLLISPAFSFFQFKNSELIGFFGWANPLRYAGVLAISVGAAQLAYLQNPKKRKISLLLFGILLGLLAMISQENLVMGSGLIVLLIVANFSISVIPPNVVRRTLGWTFLGFCSSVLLISFFYLRSGNTWRFISNYFFMPRAVRKGYSNSQFVISENPCCDKNLQHAPLFILALMISVVGGVLLAHSLVQASRRGDLIKTRTLWMIFVLWLGSTIVLGGSLTRMDASHVAGSSIFVPVWLVPALWTFTSNKSRPTKLVIRVLSVALFAATAVYANNRSLSIVEFAKWSESRFSQRFQDVGKSSSNYLISLQLDYGFSSGAIDDFSNWLLKVPIGPTYLDPVISVHVGHELGLYYFLGNLDPFPIPFDEQMMAISQIELDLNESSLRDPERSLCNLVTTDMESSTVDAVRMSRDMKITSMKLIGDQHFYLYRNTACNVG